MSLSRVGSLWSIGNIYSGGVEFTYRVRRKEMIEITHLSRSLAKNVFTRAVTISYWLTTLFTYIIEPSNWMTLRQNNVTTHTKKKTY